MVGEVWWEKYGGRGMVGGVWWEGYGGRSMVGEVWWEKYGGRGMVGEVGCSCSCRYNACGNDIFYRVSLIFVHCFNC